MGGGGGGGDSPGRPPGLSCSFDLQSPLNDVALRPQKP